MRLLQAPRHSLRHASSSHYIPHSRTVELSAQYEPSRHDAQILAARTVPTDPYTAWLEQREADRRSSAVAEAARPADQFSRNQPTSAVARRAGGTSSRQSTDRPAMPGPGRRSAPAWRSPASRARPSESHPTASRRTPVSKPPEVNRVEREEHVAQWESARFTRERSVSLS
jgi:hypothetical protein